MTTLTKLLEYGFAGPNEQKRILKSYGFKKTLEGKIAFDKEGEELGDAHALLQSDAQAIADSTLVQEEVYNTVIEGTEPVRCMRDVFPVVATDSYSVRFVKGEVGTYADKVSEGGAIPIDTQTYTKQDITIDKYGTRPLITNELIEDGLFDVVDLELRKAGARMENKLNRVILYQILQGTYAIATNTLNPAGPHIAISDYARAIALVKDDNFIPDIMVTHPIAEGYLLQDSNLAYASYANGTEALRGGSIGSRILGLKPYTCTATDAADPTWDDTTAASDVTSFICSKNDLGVLCMRRDLTVEQYDDPIHDLIGMSLTMRYGCDVLNELAGCIIYHK